MTVVTLNNAKEHIGAAEWSVLSQLLAGDAQASEEFGRGDVVTAFNTLESSPRVHLRLKTLSGADVPITFQQLREAIVARLPLDYQY